jgi:hypothetical protein
MARKGKQSMINGNGVSWKWVATTVLLPVVVVLVSVVWANQENKIASNIRAVEKNSAAIVRVESKVDSMITEMRIQSIRDSVFQSTVLKALNVKPAKDSS